MSYKPTEHDLMAYLYGELEGDERAALEQYLLEHADARLELEKLQGLRRTLAQVKDKEVIAPPIFVGDRQQHYFWHTPYFKTIVSIAASLLIVMLVGKLAGLNIRYQQNELKISFNGGAPETVPVAPATAPPTIASAPTLTQQQVQDMINTSVQQNNAALQASLSATEQKLNASIRQSLALNSGQVDNLVKQASSASQQQVRDFVASLQTENAKLVKSYFQLSANEQKQYVEGLLVDFAKYLQQQRNDDLQIVKTQINSLQQNTDLFKQETEQILTSIITTVGTGKNTSKQNLN
ncbi:anti-sigma factor family protein [Chryseolinea lacunae]|uniref:Zinc-finger domain-containing protein n=1 Tax=Chryseolinea lacunae TaxID=2801331 RepID=A0ABS1KUI2_9BACT|nr:hypothetical protein [Chryseolinea lacunae]MBL0742958.1 hypothetical protein [Chryseolinea lacunae]